MSGPWRPAVVARLARTLGRTITTMRITPFSCIIAVFLSSAASATPVFESWHFPATSDEELGVRETMTKCVKSELGRSLAGRRECFGEENTFQDARLNRAYKSALAKLSLSRQKILQESQRGWLRMFPAHCQFEAGYPNGGTDALEENDLCEIRWRAYRAKYLEAIGP